MQLLVLKLNTGIGRTLGHVATLQRENAQLNIEDSMYSSENRVAPLATAAGMTLAPAGTVHFVTASMTDISRAAAALSTAAQASASAASAASTAGGESSGESTGNEAASQTSGWSRCVRLRRRRQLLHRGLDGRKCRGIGRNPADELAVEYLAVEHRLLHSAG